MKKTAKIIISVLMILGMISVGMAFAQKGMKHHGGFMGPQSEEGVMPPPRHPGKLIGKFMHDNLAAEVLSELTGKDLETIKTEMEETHIGEILESYEIEFETFKTAMDAKTILQAEKAAQCGLITEAQAAEIKEAYTTTDTDTGTDTNTDTDTESE